MFTRKFKSYRLKKGVVVRGNCLDVLPKIKEGSVDLIFSDPPFNIGYEYDQYHDKLPKKEYKNWTVDWIKACARVMKPNASIFVAIGDENVAMVKTIMDKYFTMRNWIIWHYTFGVYCKTKFGRDHAHILYYVNNPKSFTFNSTAIREPSARQVKYNDARGDKAGRVPGDVWQFPRVCGTFKERNDFGHKCQMPSGILERCIRATTNPGDVVLDPFGGTGTTAVVAQTLKRRFITCEISKPYVKGILRRLNGTV